MRRCKGGGWVARSEQGAVRRPLTRLGIAPMETKPKFSTILRWCACAAAVLAVVALSLLALLRTGSGSDRSGLPVVSIAAVPTDLGARLRIFSGGDLTELEGLALRAVPGESDVYLARVLSGPQYMDATRGISILPSMRATWTQDSYVESRLDDYPRFSDLMPRRFPLPIIKIYARSGRTEPASDGDWHAAGPPSTFPAWPTEAFLVKKLDLGRNWTLDNIGISRRPLPALPGAHMRSLSLSLDRQFGAVNLAERERFIGPAAMPVGTGGTIISFINMAKAERIDPSFELEGVSNLAGTVQATWTPDNRFLICIESPRTPETTYRRMWIVPFEHGRTRPVGPWNHIRYVDHPAYAQAADEGELQIYAPKSEAEFVQPAVPKEWAEPVVPDVP